MLANCTWVHIGMQLLSVSRITHAYFLCMFSCAYFLCNMSSFTTSLCCGYSPHMCALYIRIDIHGLLENVTSARHFHEAPSAGQGDQMELYAPFLRLLDNPSWPVREKACRVLTKLLSQRPNKNALSAVTDDKAAPAAAGKVTVPHVPLGIFLNWSIGEFRLPSHTRSVDVTVAALAVLLREKAVRLAFVSSGGVALLEPLLNASQPQNIQLLYTATLCVWELSFEPSVVASAGRSLIKGLLEMARGVTKEKVVRVAVLALKNILQREEFLTEAVDMELLRMVRMLRLQAWSDEDLLEALEALEELLTNTIKVLSSFESYKRELMSGTLNPNTSSHKDEAFWKENILKFEVEDFQVVRVLVKLLETSNDPGTLACACHDLGQFVQHHARGREVLQETGGKAAVMKLMAHSDEQVRKKALLAVQKLMLSSKFSSFMAG
eukprot:jgi/Mesvir1/12337/Mv00523-RA.1